MKILKLVITILLASAPLFILHAQEPSIKREITLYNPFKPSLPEVVKKNLLPDMTDTAKVRPDIKYDIRSYPYSPPYNISPLKPATMVPDPLNKLYNSYINMGIGTHLTPLAEISITNQRSKTASYGLYAGHYSTNGKIKLDNGKKAFAGYTDNDISLFGRKLLREKIIKGSLDFSQKTRYAYGYDTDSAFSDYNPSKKDIRLNNFIAGATAGISSMKTDSSELSYNIAAGYNIFFAKKDFYQHNLHINGSFSKEIRGFYAGTGIEFSYWDPSSEISSSSRFIASVDPYLKKRNSDWDLRIGAVLLFDKFFTEEYSGFHLYPNLRFAFRIIPTYLGFFAELGGKLERNTPEEIVMKNPFIMPDDTRFRIPNTSFPLIVKAGLEGETGLEGNYRISASYSIADNYILFSNLLFKAGSTSLSMGNFFIPVIDDAEVLNIRGEMSGKLDNRFSFSAEAGYFNYVLTNSRYAWGKPVWDADFFLKYNLRDKIIARAGINATGERKFMETIPNILSGSQPAFERVLKMPAALNFNLSAEYRYTKILSFWLKFNNISFSKYYEWAFYPSQRFMILAGFTYSL